MSAAVVQGQQLLFSWPGSSEATLKIPEFTIGAGEQILLRGPSGSGKSTLLSILAGIHTLSSGQLHVLGTDLASLSQRKRDKFRADHIGYVFQQFNLLPYLSVIDNVLLTAQFSEVRKKKVEQSGTSIQQEASRLLSRLGLTETLHNRKAGELSVGQQQRVAVARALFGSPELLIADEPTSALDADARHEFLKLLNEECTAAGTSLLFVTHDAGLTDEFGTVVELNTIDQAGGQL